MAEDAGRLPDFNSSSTLSNKSYCLGGLIGEKIKCFPSDTLLKSISVGVWLFSSACLPSTLKQASYNPSFSALPGNNIDGSAFQKIPHLHKIYPSQQKIPTASAHSSCKGTNSNHRNSFLALLPKNRSQATSLITTKHLIVTITLKS